MLQVLLAVAMPTVASRDASPIPGYGIEEPIWEVETTPGGPTVNITDTIENVVEELEKINPTFVSDFNLDDVENISSISPVKDRGSYIESILCDVFDWAELVAINAGLVYLKGVPGKPTTVQAQGTVDGSAAPMIQPSTGAIITPSPRQSKNMSTFWVLPSPSSTSLAHGCLAVTLLCD